MPILCQFVSSRYRTTRYELMNLIGISSGALITSLLGKSADAENLGRDFLMMITPVIIAIILQLAVLKPKTINMTDGFDRQ